MLRKDIAAAGGYDAKAPLGKRGALLKGHTIAVDSINSMIHAYVRLVAARSGVNPDDIRVAPMAPASMLAAFQSKQIDGYAMSLPWPQKAVQDGEAVVIASGPDGEPGDMIPFGHNLIVARQDTCESAKRSAWRSDSRSRRRPPSSRTSRTRPSRVLKKRFPTLDDKLLKASFDELRKVTPSPPTVSAAIIENSEKFNVDAGLLKADEKLKSYDGMFTNEYRPMMMTRPALAALFALAAAAPLRRNPRCRTSSSRCRTSPSPRRRTSSPTNSGFGPSMGCAPRSFKSRASAPPTR